MIPRLTTLHENVRSAFNCGSEAASLNFKRKGGGRRFVSGKRGTSLAPQRKLSARATVFSRASHPQLVPVSPVLLWQIPGGDQHSDGPGHARSPLNEPLFFQVDYHLMHRRGTDLKMPLHFVFRRRNAMHLRVLTVSEKSIWWPQSQR